MQRNEAYRTAAMQAINEFWRERYRPPTVRQVMALSGLRSTSTTSRVLDDLEEQGMILKSGSKGESRVAVPLWVQAAIREAKTT